jgi:hypothetical protein
VREELGGLGFKVIPELLLKQKKLSSLGDKCHRLRDVFLATTSKFPDVPCLRDKCLRMRLHSAGLEPATL